MQDRVPLYPGRVTLTPVEGQENTYDMVRADQPTQEGTPLSKANLLKDTTAALFGLGSAAVPDDVLAFVGKYNEHWWSLLHGEAYSYYAEKLSSYQPETTIEIFARYSNTTIQYADDVEVDAETGTISLVSSISLTVRHSSYSNVVNAVNTIAGKYILGAAGAADKVLYIDPSNLPSIMGSESGDNTGAYYSVSSTITEVVAAIIQVPAGETTYEHSTDRNAYPDSGTVDGIMYTYLGVPFEKFPAMPQIETGRYTGTGVSENILTFGFSPKLVVIMGDNVSTSTSVITTGTALVLAILVKPVEHGFGIDTVQATSFRERFRVSWDDNTVSYRYDLANASANAYNYLALG